MWWSPWVVEQRPVRSSLDTNFNPDNLQATVLKRIGKRDHRIEHIVLTCGELPIREVLTFLFHRNTGKGKSRRALSRNTEDTEGDQD